jgi:YidC/Oxa1 family membrane protein insertase
MERRLLIAIALAFVVLFLWNVVLFPPPPPPRAPDRPMTPAEGGAIPEPRPVPAGGVAPAPTPAVPPATIRAEPPEPAGAVEAAGTEEHTLETDVYRIRLANRGGAVVSWQLKKYRDDDGKPLEMVSPGAAKLDQFPFHFLFSDPDLTRRLNTALYQMQVEPGIHGIGHRVTFRFADGAGLSAAKTLDFSPGSYVAHLETAAWKDGKPIEGRVVWGAGFGPHPGTTGRSSPEHAIGVVLARGGKIVRHPKTGVEKGREERETGPIAWAGLEDRYFAALLLPVGGSGGVSYFRRELIEEGREKDFLSLAIDPSPERNYDLFIGPKDYDLLAGMRIGVEGIVDFGFFGSIAQALFFLLKWINRATGNWGWAIVLLTFLIRLVFFPLTHKSMISMRRTQEKMKRVQPRMQAIKERYRKLQKSFENRQKMNGEIMALYQKEGINPLSGMTGCLPLLLQIPILWGFYNLLNVAIELRQAPFALWIQDLSKKDPYYVTPIVMGITMLIQQVMTGSTIPDPVQRRMMMLMPVIFTWFFKDFASGLVLYWLVNNVLAIGQQYLINRQAARAGVTERARAKG